MAITIDDIYDKEFLVKGAGYDRDDVDQFLDDICDEMIRMQEQITALEGNLASAQKELAAEKAIEKTVAPTPVVAPVAEVPATKTSERLEKILMNAERLADEQVQSAKDEAKSILTKAKDEASQLVDDAREEKKTITDTLDGLKESIRTYRSGFKDLVSKHATMVDEDLRKLGLDD